MSDPADEPVAAAVPADPTASQRRRRKPVPLPAIDPGRCTGCGWCVGACSDLHLLSLEVVAWKKTSVLHQPERCTGCRACELKCPFGAITMRRVDQVGAQPVDAPISMTPVG
jgi:ferredoxin